MDKNWTGQHITEKGKAIYGAAAREAKIKADGGIQNIIENAKKEDPKIKREHAQMNAMRRDFLIASSGVAGINGNDYSFVTCWDSSMTEAERNQPLKERLEKIRVLSPYVR